MTPLSQAVKSVLPFEVYLKKEISDKPKHLHY